MFASFLRPGADEELYEEVRDVDRLIKLLGDYMEEFNETNHSQVCVMAVLSFVFGVPICLSRPLFRGRGHLAPASTPLQASCLALLSFLPCVVELPPLLCRLLSVSLRVCRQTNLVFFEDAVKHIVRISRVLRLSRGSALLIGIGGSGKQSLTRLAAAIANYPTSQIEAGSSYGPADFREDLKEVLHVAGVEGKHVVLLLSDSQVDVIARAPVVVGSAMCVVMFLMYLAALGCADFPR
jgi:hypothetical protein